NSIYQRYIKDNHLQINTTTASLLHHVSHLPKNNFTNEGTKHFIQGMNHFIYHSLEILFNFIHQNKVEYLIAYDTFIHWISNELRIQLTNKAPKDEVHPISLNFDRIKDNLIFMLYFKDNRLNWPVDVESPEGILRNIYSCLEILESWTQN